MIKYASFCSDAGQPTVGCPCIHMNLAEDLKRRLLEKLNLLDSL